MTNEVVEEVSSFVTEVKEANNSLIQASGFLIVAPFLGLSLLAATITRMELVIVSVPMIIASVFLALSIGLIVRLNHESALFSGAIAMSTMLTTYSDAQLKSIDSILGEGYIDRLRKQVKTYHPSKHSFPTGGWAFTFFGLGVAMLVVTLVVAIVTLTI